ncbi:MAG TPA: B12-binding domain-containing protein, partial [Anaerolinea sp.]|nr:B12-binding domain-containing protein [Anaerolinea sp.]
MDEKIRAIFQCIVEGDNTGVQENVHAALAAGLDAGTILNQGLIAGMAEVGRLFEEGEDFVPEMLISARAMKSAMA